MGVSRRMANREGWKPTLPNSFKDAETFNSVPRLTDPCQMRPLGKSSILRMESSFCLWALWTIIPWQSSIWWLLSHRWQRVNSKVFPPKTRIVWSPRLLEIKVSIKSFLTRDQVCQRPQWSNRGSAFSWGGRAPPRITHCILRPSQHPQSCKEMRSIQRQRNCTHSANQVPVITTSLGHLTMLKIKAWGNTVWELRSAGKIFRGSGRSPGKACTSGSLKINPRYLGQEPMRLLSSQIYWLCVKPLDRRGTLSPRTCAPLTERHVTNSGSLSNKRKKITLNSMHICRSSWRTKWSHRSR